MMKDERLSEIYSLYEEGNYFEALRASQEKLNESEDNKVILECCILAACSIAKTIEPDEEVIQMAKELMENKLTIAVSMVDTIDEVMEIGAQVAKALNERFIELADIHIPTIITIDDYNNLYISFFMKEFADFHMFILMTLAAAANAIRETHEEEKDKKISIKGFIDEEVKLYREAKLFEHGVNIYNEVVNAADDFPYYIMYDEDEPRPIIGKYILAELIFNQTIGDKEDEKEIDDKTLVCRMKYAVSLYTDMLNAKIASRNEARFSLFSVDNQRKEYYERRCEYEKRIKKFEPDFEAPAVMVAGIQAPTQTASGGCYVATAVYGSYDCAQVWTLRRYRDYTLAETWYGRAFIKIYYAISPALVKWFGETKWFKKFWKKKLDLFVSRLQESGVSDKPYIDKKW